MSKQAMNRLLGSLEDLGYLVRSDVPGEGRARIVHLTKRGHAAYAKALEVLRDVEREWSAELGPRISFGSKNSSSAFAGEPLNPLGPDQQLATIPWKSWFLRQACEATNLRSQPSTAPASPTSRPPWPWSRDPSRSSPATAARSPRPSTCAWRRCPSSTRNWAGARRGRASPPGPA